MRRTSLLLLLIAVASVAANLRETMQKDTCTAADRLLDPGHPPNSPDTACERAKSVVGKYTHWWCNQFVNWCYFNSINKGGSPQSYCGWPAVGTAAKTGTIVCGPSVLAGYWHVGVMCDSGTKFCDAPLTTRAIRCVDVSHLKTTFKSYSFHYPTGY